MNKRTLLLAGFAAVAFSPAPAWAAENDAPAPAAEDVAADDQAGVDSASGPNLPENVIIITARRRNEQAQEVPLAISVLDERAINDTGSNSIYKVQQLTPTLQVYSQNPRNTAVNIRGIGVPFGLTNDGFEQGVGIYVDDVYYSRPASAVFDFLDVNQVEVLRGPQGTLYGKNTTAGAINIRTNQPTFDFDGSAELNLGNYDYRNAKVAISGPISDSIAVRLAASGSSRQGTIYNVTSGNHINAQDNLGIRGQVLFRPSSDLDIILSGDYSAQDAECCGTVFVRYGPTQKATNRQFPAIATALGYAPPSTDPFDRLSDVDANLNAGNITGGASLKAIWDVGDSAAITSITAWRFWDWKPENDRDYSGLDVVRKSQNPSQQNQYSQELRFNYSSDRLDFVIGAFAFHQRIDTQGTEVQGADSSYYNLSGANRNIPSVLEGLTAINTQYLKATSLAAFGQVSYELFDGFKIQPGVRINYDKKKGLYDRQVFDGLGVEVPATGGGQIRTDQRSIFAPQLIEPVGSDWNFSYDVTASYRPAPDVLLYATYAKSFKSFGLNQNGVPALNGVPQIDLATAKPESINHYEAGLKTQFWDRRATFNLSVYRTVIDDFQASLISTRDPGLVRPYIANAEQARSQGIEADFQLRPSDRLSFYATGAYTDAEYTRFTKAPPPPEFTSGSSTTAAIDADGNIIQPIGAPGVPLAPGTFSPPYVDASGGALPGVSKWSFSVGGEANTPLTLFGKDGELFGGVDVSYRSKFSSNPTPSIYTWIDGYTLTNFRAGFRGDGFSIYGWVRNAFDAEYFDQLLVAPANTGLIAGIPGDPRTWGGTVRFDF
jgi:iron complex outermembrane receptor protein